MKICMMQDGTRASYLSAIAIDERLIRAKWRLVRLFDVIQKLESIAKLIVHRLGAVPDNVEPAAFFGTAQAKRSDDNVAVSLERTFYLLDILAALVGGGEEMKYGTVMPEVVGVFG
jgi:hypothetical protein